MSYRTSRARREFESQLSVARRELRELYPQAQQRGSGNRLLGAYYVFSYALLEVFVRSLVEESIRTFDTVNPPMDAWPDLMIGFMLHRSEELEASYRRYYFDGDEGAILTKVSALARKVATWTGGTPGIVAPNAAHILERKKYPSPRNMPQLFRRLGVPNIWTVVGRHGRMNGELVLTSLNDLRTDIAHEGRVPPGFSIGDFRNRTDQMRKLVGAIDRSVAFHFCSAAIQRAAWNRAMC